MTPPPPLPLWCGITVSNSVLENLNSRNTFVFKSCSAFVLSAYHDEQNWKIYVHSCTVTLKKILRLSFKFLLETILKSLHASMISKKYSLVLLRKVWYAIFFKIQKISLILTLYSFNFWRKTCALFISEKTLPWKKNQSPNISQIDTFKDLILN